MTDRPLPTRWRRFLHPDHDTQATPQLKLLALATLALAIANLAVGAAWAAGVFACIALSTWSAARMVQSSYQVGYWQAHADIAQSADRAVRDGIDGMEWMQREHDRIATLLMQWNQSRTARWQRRR